ncbi:MAG TPA: adenylyltransferase/cytidyltransferase family protein [Patescibacteria group bacterium]|nr:adenylyltransferase/cytidyltransferase family protein [Patescibacteria group bacterium]
MITIEQINQTIEPLKNQQKKIVLVGGCFDILHIGHIALLEGARKAGDVLFVMLESDETIQKRKGPTRPLHTQKQRARVLESLRFVDYVIALPPLENDQEYDRVVKALQPDIIATTKSDPGLIHKERVARITGAQVIFVNEFVDTISSTRSFEALQKEL